MQAVRLFVSGLPPDITQDLIRQRFAAFGTVTALEAAVGKGFVHFDLLPKDPKALDRCITTVRISLVVRIFVTQSVSRAPDVQPGLTAGPMVQYNGCQWRGSRLRVERARPSKLDQYARERVQEAAAAEAPQPEQPAPEQPAEPSLPQEPMQPLHLVHPGTQQVKLAASGLLAVDCIASRAGCLRA